MLGKLFKKNADDLIEEIKNKNFNESKADAILKDININHTNQNLQNFLHLATLKNNYKAVAWLLKNGISFNEPDAEGQTALQLACKYKYIKCIEELLKYDVDVNKQDHDRKSAIEYIIENDLIQVYIKIKSKIKNINTKNSEGLSLLQIAIKNKSVEIVKDLLENPNLKNKENILFFKETFLEEDIFKLLIPKFQKFSIEDKNKRNALFYIVENGAKSKKMFSAFTQIVDVNHVDEEGNNILFHYLNLLLNKEQKLQKEMSNKELEEEIEELINFIPNIVNSGIDLNVSNKNNETILLLPIKFKSLRVLTKLLECEIDVNIKNKNRDTALHYTINKSSDYLEINQLLLDFEADPNIKNKDNITPLEKLIDAILVVKSNKEIDDDSISFSMDYISLLEAILQNTNANLNMLNSKREPYFFEALRFGNFDLIKIFMKNGIDINQVDMEGTHILYKYMQENLEEENPNLKKQYYENLKTILLLGADVNTKDSFGGVTLHKAILDLDINVVRILLNAGANINAIDDKGRTMVHNAVWKNDLKMFKYIYAHCQKQLNKPDKFGVLPINYAAFLGYSNLVHEMIELNAHINNTNKKSKYILDFLKKFHNNLPKILEEITEASKKDKVTKLISNMKKEFEVNS